MVMVLLWKSRNDYWKTDLSLLLDYREIIIDYLCDNLFTLLVLLHYFPCILSMENELATGHVDLC